MEVHHRLLERDAEFAFSLGQIETTARTTLRAAAVPMKANISVVVHVLYSSPLQNISDAQVASQIAALNRDYGATNPDRADTPAVWAGLVTDTGISFGLATTDPEGKQTTGITRTQTKKTSFSTDDGCKSASTGGVDPWPTDRYLNIWVCNLSGGVLGYAQFPGGPRDTDGVVILYSAFGTEGTATAPFNLGRTAVHEVGHWLNLRHIWGDTEDCTGDDMVADTPHAQHPNYGTPAFPHVSCTNGPNGDMFMNYMDYVNDSAMVMFTAGQVARMQATLNTARSALVSFGATLVS